MRTLLNRLQRGIPGPHHLLGPIDSLDTHNGMTRIVDVCLLITFEVLTGFKGLVRQSLGFFILIFEKIFNFFYVFLQVLDLIGDHPDTSSKLILTSTAIILQIFEFIACILDNMKVYMLLLISVPRLEPTEILKDLGLGPQVVRFNGCLDWVEGVGDDGN